MIDAHVHLMQPAGSFDAIFGETTGRFGKLLEPDGSVFQYLPPFLHDCRFDAEILIETMNCYGIEQAVVLAHLGTGVNEAGLLAQRAYPDRLHAACSVSPMDPDAAEQIRSWAEQGVRIAKFEMRSLNELFGDVSLGGRPMQTAIEAAAGSGMTVAVDPGPVAFPCYEPEAFAQTAARFSDTHFVLCHMGLPHCGIQGDAELLAKWRSMMEALRLPNVWTDTSAIPDVFDEEGYPYPSAMELFDWTVSTFGADKVIWGTDIPGTLRNATYPQMIRMFCDGSGLDEKEMERLFHKNAVAAYGL